MSKDRKNQYAFVAGELEGEGFRHDGATLLKALRLNPESAIEKAMRAKSEKELQKIGEEIIEAQDAFEQGYFEGAPKRKVLTQTEHEEIARYAHLLKSNDPTSMSIAKTELEGFCAKKISEGVCEQALKERIAKELK